MRVCVVGGGGREHALVHVLARTCDVVATPGNPGIARLAECTGAPAEEIDADLFVIGPELPLIEGLADRLRARGRLVFGPGADGARLEASKAWMKSLFERASIPTARHGAFDAVEPAVQFLKTMASPYVVKADGAAAGKGVLVTDSLDEAVDDVRAKIEGGSFGDAGRRVVIEEGLRGEELSVLAVTDGRQILRLVPAQDFKRIGDDDSGPNTGGMGAYAPAVVDVDDAEVDGILERTLAALRDDGIDYRGVLYLGLMLTAQGPKVLEYNARFGDPETQVVLPLLEGDVAALLASAASGALHPDEVKPSGNAAVTVVLATENYPGTPRTGDVIEGIDDAESHDGVAVFHAGTERDEAGRLVTAGGRVLDVTAVAPTVPEARALAYDAVTRIRWPGMYHRHDIAARAARAASSPGVA